MTIINLQLPVSDVSSLHMAYLMTSLCTGRRPR